MAFQSSLGDEFANEPSRVEQDLRDGLLTITNVAPELTRRFVLIVRATRRERFVRRLRWRGTTVCPSSTATREKDRLDFHSFIFTAISLIATPSLLLRSFQRRRGVSFTLIPGFTLITRSAAPLSFSLSSVQVKCFGNPSNPGILSLRIHPYRANSSRDKKGTLQLLDTAFSLSLFSSSSFSSSSWDGYESGLRRFRESLSL